MPECPDQPNQRLTAARPNGPVPALSVRVVVPAMIAHAGERATLRYLEFFGALTEKPMNCGDAWRTIQRRAEGLGFQVKISRHSYRVTGITASLDCGGTVENAQAMAIDESPQTAKLFALAGDPRTLVAVKPMPL